MAAKSLALQVGVAPACRALGVPRATFYRRHRSTPGRQQPRSTPARALCEDERERVLEMLSSPRFVDRSPAEVVATLLDEGQYVTAHPPASGFEVFVTVGERSGMWLSVMVCGWGSRMVTGG